MYKEEEEVQRDSRLVKDWLDWLENAKQSLAFIDSSVEEKLHGESKMIQRCFDDNKDDDKKPMRMISRLSQEQFKNQEKE